MHPSLPSLPVPVLLLSNSISLALNPIQIKANSQLLQLVENIVVLLRLLAPQAHQFHPGTNLLLLTARISLTSRSL